jgi:hypothetical protein
MVALNLPSEHIAKRTLRMVKVRSAKLKEDYRADLVDLVFVKYDQHGRPSSMARRGLQAMLENDHKYVMCRACCTFFLVSSSLTGSPPLHSEPNRKTSICPGSAQELVTEKEWNKLRDRNDILNTSNSTPMAMLQLRLRTTIGSGDENKLEFEKQAYISVFVNSVPLIA